MFSFRRKNDFEKEKERKLKELKIEMDNGKRERTRKTRKVISIVSIVAIVLAIALFAALSLIFKNNSKLNKTISSSSGEHARAMTYDLFTNYDVYEEGTDNVIDNVKFGAFFLRNNNGIAEPVNGSCREIGKTDMLFMDLSVLREGYFKEGSITIVANNFYLRTVIPKDNEIKDNVFSTNTQKIEFNIINAGTQKTLFGDTTSGIYSSDNSDVFQAVGPNINNYSAINQIILKGTYVDNQGNETEVEKVVDLQIDWYSTTKTEIPLFGPNRQGNLNQVRDISTILDTQNQQVSLNFDFFMRETMNKLILHSAVVNATLPQINGYDPISVAVSGSDVEYNYDEQTRALNITKKASVDREGNITKNCYDDIYFSDGQRYRYNAFQITVNYPMEAYQGSGNEPLSLSIPIEAYYLGYNNDNREFNNPYKSNVAQNVIEIVYTLVPGEDAGYSVWVGKYLNSPTTRYVVSKAEPIKLYNEMTDSTTDQYEVRWSFSTGTNIMGQKVVLKETKEGTPQKVDTLVRADSTEVELTGLSKNVGLYFINHKSVLGENGEIKIYDDTTGDLIVTFNKDNWDNYSSSQPYLFPIPIDHIRVEMSEIVGNGTIAVINIKQLNDESIINTYSRSEFDKFVYVKSYMAASIGGMEVEQTSSYANYELPYSLADISLSKATISTQETEKDYKIKIKTYSNELLNQEGWKDGIFVIKLPEEIANLEIKSVECNNSTVTISSYEQYTENGAIFIKVQTENDIATGYTITINCDLTPDSRTVTATKNVSLFAINSVAEDYCYKASDIYDIDSDENVQEIINSTNAGISLISPNSLLTTEYISNYDDNNSVTIAPNSALVSKETRQATIFMEVKNNYTNPISDIVLVGRIPFAGNKYVLNGKTIGSTFDTQIINTGIVLPEELLSKVTIYYSENGEATKDLNDLDNGWVQNPSDFSSIKSFLVVLGDYQLPVGESFTLSYDVNIPAGLNFNDVSYSHHAVYFSLETVNGKYRTSIEPNKVGLQIAKEIDLLLTKNQTGSNRKVKGATYMIRESGEEEGKTRVTNQEGHLTFKGLLVDVVYELTEIKTPEEYEKSEDIVKFKILFDETGLHVELIEGNPKELVAVPAQGNTDNYISVKVEDEVKPRLKITKLEKNTTNKLSKVKYRISGEGLPETGKYLSTNNDGEISLKGLFVGKEYVIEEVKAEGYYLSNPIKIKVLNNGEYSLDIMEGTVKNHEITIEDEIPVANITVEDEKIPTYNLNVLKIKKNEPETVIPGVVFRLYKDNDEIGEYTTDSNGNISIMGLYEYVESKQVDQTYVLKEVYAPEGYSKVKDIEFRVQRNSEDKLEIIEKLSEGQREKEYTVQGNTINLIVEDSPSFLLVKKDGETNELLPNVKFAIYNIANGIEPARNSKGEIIGTKENINGEEYYVVTTNERGEITADLPEGIYKAVELEADEKYDLENAEQYFGIGGSREGKSGFILEDGFIMSGDSVDTITSVITTPDGGYIVGGYFSSYRITIGNNQLENNYNMLNSGYNDPVIFKLDSELEVEWVTTFGTPSHEYVKTIAPTSDGGCVVAGEFSSSSTAIGGITLPNKGQSDIFLTKLSPNGEVEWAKCLGGSGSDNTRQIVTTENDEIIVVGTYGPGFKAGEIELPFGGGGPDAFIAKYSSTGQVVWARNISGTSTEQITSVTVTSDGDYIVGGSYAGATTTIGEFSLVSNSPPEDGIGASGLIVPEGLIARYSKDGEVEWATSIGGTSNDCIYSVTSTVDGGFIAGGYFEGNINVEGFSIRQYSSVIKYSKNNQVEWTSNLDGKGIKKIISTDLGKYYVFDSNNSRIILDVLSFDGSLESRLELCPKIDETINSIIMDDNNIIIVGKSGKSFSTEKKSLINSGTQDGVLLKYSTVDMPEVEAVYGKSFLNPGENNVGTNLLITQNDGYIIPIITEINPVDLGNGYVIGSNKKALVKFSKDDEVEWVKTLSSGSNNFYLDLADDQTIFFAGMPSSQTFDGITLDQYEGGIPKRVVAKYDSDGTINWATAIGSIGEVDLRGVIATSDGGCIVVGGFSQGLAVKDKYLQTSGVEYAKNGFVIKFDASGDVEWLDKMYDEGFDWCFVKDAIETNNEYVVVGNIATASFGPTGGATIDGSSYRGAVIRYSKNGDRLNKTIPLDNVVCDMKKAISTSDNGFVIMGDVERGTTITADYGAELFGTGDVFLMKINARNEIEWFRTMGGSSYDRGFSLSETLDGGFLISGNTQSSPFVLNNGVSLLSTIGSGHTAGFIAKVDKYGIAKWGQIIKSPNSLTNDKAYGAEQLSNGKIMVTGELNSYNIVFDSGIELVSNGRYNRFILKMEEKFGVPEQEEITFENFRKEYKITTSVKQVGAAKGGTISGEGTPYETVKHGDSNSKPIIMTPDENYEIINITVNEEEWPFEANEDGSYTMPVFNNIKEDLRIVVTFAAKNNKITINKVDSVTNETLYGGKFKLDQIEERMDPVTSEIIGSIQADDTTYSVFIPNEEVQGTLGELTSNGVQFFVNKNGKIVPTNSKTYQVENGGIAGIQNSIAWSYIPIDLTNLTGQYGVVLNAEISSERNDKGIAFITTSTTAPTYNSEANRFMYIFGYETARNYTSQVLEGGNIYYLHIGYRKDGSIDNGTDQLIINGVKVYSGAQGSETYNLAEQEGKYVSTNQGKGKTYSSSCFPVDLTDYVGKYILTVNVDYSTELSTDYAYAIINKSTSRPTYYSSTGSIFYDSGNKEAKEYSIEIQGGSLYYLHLGYYKSSYNISNGDIFRVNNINISLSDSELWHTEVEGNSEGQAITEIPFGKYYLTEIKAPDGYKLESEPQIIEFRDNGTHEFTITNDKISKVIVHHYIKGTTTKLAEDVIVEGAVGEDYQTLPNISLDKYELEKDGEGEYILPDNSTGVFAYNDTEVTYYYVKKKVPLTVHHYIEGTLLKVPLKNGGTSTDVTAQGEEGETYTTSPLSNDELDESYELVNIPANASGTYAFPGVEVTYYYKPVKRTLTINKYEKDTNAPLENAVFKVDNQDHTTDGNGKIVVDLGKGNHTIREKTAPSGYEPIDEQYNITINRGSTDQELNIENEKIKGTITVHHYIQRLDGTKTTEKVKLADGTEAEDEVRSGYIDEIYATMPKTNLSPTYKLSEEPENASGEYINGNIDIIYYYQEQPGKVTVHHYIEGTTTRLADDVVIDGLVGDNYTTGMANVENKYELVVIPTNANGIMTIEDIEVTYYYRLKNTSVTVHYYIEGTSTSLAPDVVINGKVDDSYTTQVATVPSKYILVAEPTNKNGTMTVEPITVTYFFRLKDTGVDVHYYLLDNRGNETTNRVLHADGTEVQDITIPGRVDDSYTTQEATNVMSKYRLVRTTNNTSGTMTEDRITVIYYYQAKDTSVLVHHFVEGTTNKVPNKTGGTVQDVVINGKVDDSYTTIETTDKAVYYELVAEPTNKSGIMTEDQIVVTYFYRLKNYPYVVNYLEKGTNEVLNPRKQGEEKVWGTEIGSGDETISIDGYRYVEGNPETLTITENENVLNLYYQKRNDLSYTVHYKEKGTNKTLHTDKVVNNQIYLSTINSVDEKIDIDGYYYDSVDKDTLTITTGTNEITVFYTKRTDLSYTVYYKEKGTGRVLHDPKTVNNQTFETVINSENEKIDINGFNFDSFDKNSLTITTGTNEITVFYTKRTDLSYTVYYKEKGTSRVLHDPKTVNNQTFETLINAENEKINIDGFNFDSFDKNSLTIGTGTNEITIFYTKRTDLSYTVKYLEKGTGRVLHDPKTVNNQTFEAVITSSNEVIDIDGFNYDSVDKDTLTITTGTNEITVFYTKRTDLSYIVNYYEKVGNENVEIHGSKTVNNQTFEATINTQDEVIDIIGYNFDYTVPGDSLIITTGTNVIDVFYTRVTGISYTVNYIDVDTNERIIPSSTTGDMTYGDVVNSSDEVIDIDGYNYARADKDSLTISVEEEQNFINLYYKKRGDLSYTVKYLEKGTNEVLHEPKVVTDQVFNSVITSNNEVIGIDGYNYDSVDKDTLTITTGTNEITVFYTKRTDLSYTVHYVEKGTGRVLHEDKTVNNQTYLAVINANDEIIDIDGFNYDSLDKDNLVIGTGVNEITVMYTKKADLSYTVYYLEKGTSRVLHDPKVVTDQVFESVITSSNEIIDIDGFNYDSVDKDTLTITTGTNEITIFYTKRTDLSYTVNYLEKGSEEVLHQPKEVSDQVFESVITSTDEVIDIDGYNFDSADRVTLTIGTGTNEINLYYTKRTDLTYKVNYFEKGTGRELKEQKIVSTARFEDTIYAVDEIIAIRGFDFDSFDKAFVTITTNPDENIINLYYTKRNGLGYTVNYLEKGTDKIIQTPKTASGKTFEDVVLAEDEIITIYGYNYDSSSVDELVISDVDEENVINLYYTRRPAKVIAHYYEENSTNKVTEDRTFNGLVNDTYETDEGVIPLKYELIAEPINKTGIFTEDDIEVIYYYRKKATTVVVHHLEDPTTNGGLYVMLADDETLNYRVDDEYVTHPSSDVPIKYELVETKLPSNATGTATLETIEVTYYYQVKDGIVNIRYVDRFNGQEIADRESQTGKVDERYVVSEKPISGYTYVDNSGNAEGNIAVDPTLVTFYYAKNVNLITRHIDKITGSVLATDTDTNKKQGDAYETNSKDIANYVLAETPSDATGTMGHEDKTVDYYYLHISEGLIEKHIDVISGEVLYNELHEGGNEGDEYTINPRTFANYDLVEERIPANAHGYLTPSVTTVTYYYIRKADVVVKYIEKYSGAEIPNDDGTSSRESWSGHENDPYTTTSKNFEGYVLEALPSNANGNMNPGTNEITYIYKRISGGVVVNHINILTGEQLVDEARLPGYVGEDYTTEEAVLSNYDLVEMPQNASGKFQVNQINVTYYYREKASVTVRYVDENGNDILDELGNSTKEIINKHVGDDYETEVKFFDIYVLVEEPDNKAGTMTEEPIEVVYKYRKLRFNFNVDKTIDTVSLNGVEQQVNGPLAKIEVNRKEYASQSVRIKYSIKVTNDGEIEGTVVLREEVPSSMTMDPSLNPEWQVTSDIATLETDVLQPGETKTYSVILDWTGKDNVGTKTNIARIVTTNNKYGLDETDKSDNESKADTIIAVSTGAHDYIVIATILLVVMVGIGTIYIRISNSKKRTW